MTPLPAARLRPVAQRWRHVFVGVVWALGIGLILGTVPPPLVIVHWANGHMVDSETLYPAFAREFNRAGYRTRAGRAVRVHVVRANSGEIAGELIARTTRGAPLDRTRPDPTLVTPAADHWLSEVNQAVGRSVVDLERLQTPATTYIGIVTTRELARCIGWPERDVGFSDVVAVAVGSPPDPEAARCLQPPRLRAGFTYPARSSTARSVLYSLVAIAAGTSPERLTAADVSRPAVGGYIDAFRNTIDCYVPDTLDLNRKVLAEPSCAHFYFLAEDNLVKLYQGKIEVRSGERNSLDRDLVMIYPREGAVVHNHSAFVVKAPWVGPEQAEAAHAWIGFLNEEPQQQAFMQEGFRRGAPGVCVDPLGSPFRPCAVQPQAVIYPDRIDPAVAVEASRGWR